MALSLISSPRRFALLAVAVFFLAIVFLQSSDYRTEYLPITPDLRKPETFTSDGISNAPPPPADSVPGSKGQEHDEVKVDVPDKQAPDSPVPADTNDAATDASPTDETDKSPDAAAPTNPAAIPSPAHTSDATTNTTLLTKITPAPLPQIIHETQDETHGKIVSLIQHWDPPTVPDHWPPYNGYKGQNYNPNLWESFDWDNDFYISNGIDKFNESQVKPVAYAPYPEYNSATWKTQWKGEFRNCMGPRGKLLNDSEEDTIWAWPKLPTGFPEPAVGNAKLTGIDIEHCFDRAGRLGAYRADSSAASPVDWDSVDWGKLQEECLELNKDRYEGEARAATDLMPGGDLPAGADVLAKSKMSSGAADYHPRTAILIRSYEGYEYTDNDLESMRALVSETSLRSGGEYQVFLFLNIKDNSADVFANKTLHDELVQKHAPKEFRGITILWNEKIFPIWYPDITDWQVYWHQFMCLQWFSKTHPQFDYIWNWEVDARYTGNHYQFMEAVTHYSKKAARKYLWERNSRFYIPSAHGSFDDWLVDTDAQIQEGMKDTKFKTVWGPMPYNQTLQNPIGPKPHFPTVISDAFEWGVGEEADLITLSPIFDPTETTWTMRNKIWNFIPDIHPHFSPDNPIDETFTHEGFAELPRRAYINTVSRFSKRQLHAMHMENAAGRTMQSEMWPATVALHHGLKAVYAPHPIWTDRRWPGWYMDAVFNARGGGNETPRPARWSAQSDSVYAHDREHNFNGWSWSYRSDFPRVLYRRWLGWTASVGSEAQFPNNPLRVLGGENYEAESQKVVIPTKRPDGTAATPPGGATFDAAEVEVGGLGRMCLPPMLLHPVKNVNEDVKQEE